MKPTRSSVYLLHHVHELDDGHEDVKLIGVFSTRAKAEGALAQVKDQPGFRDLPEGFEVSETWVDHAGWLEGFVTVAPGEAGPDPASAERHEELRLDADAALVLFELLARLEDDDELSIQDAAEEQVLGRLHGQLQAALVEPFEPDYRDMLQRARARIRRRAGLE